MTDKLTADNKSAYEKVTRYGDLRRREYQTKEEMTECVCLEQELKRGLEVVERLKKRLEELYYLDGSLPSVVSEELQSILDKAKGEKE